jgi:hypothetical protein
MSKSEKRFFKLTSKLQSGPKNYLKLFDAIEKQSEYDEDAIKEEHKNESFVKHLPSEKNHLFHLILKSLRQFHAENSINSQLQEQIKNIEILYQKGLYKEGRKFIKRAKKIAYHYERFYYLFELINWEKQYLEEDFSPSSYDEELKKLMDEEKVVIDKLRNLAEYMILNSKINYVFRKGGYARNEQERAIIEEIEDYHLIKGKNTAISRRAAATCYYIQGLCAIAKGEYEKSYGKFQRVIQIFEENPHLIAQIPQQYIKALNNLLYKNIDEGNFEEYAHLVEKIEKLKENTSFKSKDVFVKIFTTTFVAEMIALDRQKKYQKGVEYIESKLDEYEKYAEDLNIEEKSLINYNIAYTYFGAGEYKKALKWVNEIVNSHDQNFREDIYIFSRLFSIIIHYELGNYELIDYLVKSTYRYMLKKKKERGIEPMTEKVFLKYMRKIARYYDKPKKVQQAFEDMYKELSETLKDPNEQIALRYFDFPEWAKNKMKNPALKEKSLA